MDTQTKQCRKCRSDFLLELDDLNYYEKIGVLVPSLCPSCRAQLRLSFRNERAFYKRPCDKCKKDVVSTFSPNKPHTVWCYDCWFSDDWDAVDYGIQYDKSKPFIEQVGTLLSTLPKVGLIYVRSSGSQYINISADNKDCYMIVESSNNENCINCYWIQQSKDLVDCSFTDKVMLSYDVDDCYDCHNLKYSKGCHSCINSYFLLDCQGCTNCFGCVNLRQQQYNIFNVPYSKENYEKFIEGMRLDTHSGLEKARRMFEEFKLKNPRKYAEIIKAISSTGTYMKNVKNCKSCFHAYDSEDCKYGVHTWRNAKDCMDVDTAGRNAELIYNSINSGLDTARQICSNLCWTSTYTSYSTYCLNSNNLLGCVGLRKKDYCILNKQYDKETYEKLKNEIIASMKESGEWGEFFPPQMSSFGYNESAAHEQFPLTKEEALAQGFKWEDTPRGTYGKETVNWSDFPDSVKDLPSDFDVNKEIFACTICNKNYRIIGNELIFYKRMNLPIPRTCTDCRHTKRFQSRGPNQLWHRNCMCTNEKHGHSSKCQNEFETNYAPERPEIIYCEKCYQQEVY